MVGSTSISAMMFLMRTIGSTMRPPLPLLRLRNVTMILEDSSVVQIFRDKTFIFLSYEGARLRVPATHLIPVPSEYARTTAPSQLAPFVDAYPQPDNQTVVPGVYTSPFTGSYSNRDNLDAGSVRIDHKISDRLMIFGRYNDAPSQALVRQNSLSSLNNTTVDTRTVTLGANATL